MVRFEELKKDIDFPAEVFSRLTDGASPATLPEIAKARGIPRGKFVEWFLSVHRDKYDAALKVLTDQLAFEVVKIADGADPEAVAKAKLQVDARLRTAARWDRERYGEGQGAAVVVNVSLVDVEKEVRELEQRLQIGRPRVIDAEAVLVVEGEAI